MTVYIVLEEDRGIGVTVTGVYPTEAQAQAACGSHKWVAEAVFDDSAIRKECADRAVAWQKKLCADDDWNCKGCTECRQLRAAIESMP